MAPRVQVPCAVSRGPLLRRESRSLGTKWKPKNAEFWAFIDPSGQNQLYHTPLLPKIWVLNDRKKLWTIPLSSDFCNSGWSSPSPPWPPHSPPGTWLCPPASKATPPGIKTTYTGDALQMLTFLDSGNLEFKLEDELFQCVGGLWYSRGVPGDMSGRSCLCWLHVSSI